MAYFFDSDERSDSEEEERPRLTVSIPRDEFAYFKVRLHEEVLRSQRRSYRFSVLHMALDDGKSTVCPEWERLLKANVREYDILCSVRPEEFLIALPETEERFAEKVADRLREALVRNGDPKARVSVGIACFPQDGANAEDLLFFAQQDMKQARELGK